MRTKYNIQVSGQINNIQSHTNNTTDIINNEDWAQLSMEQAEEKLISLVLRRFSGNAKEAAHSLGYSKSAFYRRLEIFGL